MRKDVSFQKLPEDVILGQFCPKVKISWLAILLVLYAKAESVSLQAAGGYRCCDNFSDTVESKAEMDLHVVEVQVVQCTIKRHHNSYLQLIEDGKHQFNVELVCIIMFKFCFNNVDRICNTVNVKMNFCLKECQCEAAYNFVFVCAVLCIITVIMHIRLFCVMAPEGR